MRKFLLFAIIITLLIPMAATVHAAPPPDGPPGIERAIAAQEAHSHKLLAIPGVVGTAVGFTSDEVAAVKVYTERVGVAGIPRSLDGVPVDIQITGRILSLKPGKVPPGKPPEKPKEPSPTDRWTRPVPIGVSTGNEGECSAGTLGVRVTDGTYVYALSNNHVYALKNNAFPESRILQPGRYDTECGINPDDEIGTLYQFVPLDFSGEINFIDAAIALTNISQVGTSTPASGYGTPKSTPQTVSSDIIGMQVQKFGRTTELTKGVITAYNYKGNVGYTTGSAYFEDQIVIESRKPFSKAGDSGSLIVTLDRTPLALLFAGNRTGKFILANDINTVLDAFNVTIDVGP